MTPTEIRDLSSDGKDVVLKLQPTTVYRGVVHDSDDKPLADATVRINVPQRRNMARWVRTTAEVLTDEQGKWKTPLLPKTVQRVSLQIFHPDYLTSHPHRSLLNAVRLPDELGTDTKPLKIRTKRFTLSGHVENWIGMPVDGATVDIHLRSNGNEVGVRRLVTDDAGRFSIRSTKALAVLVVRAKGYAPAVMEQQINTDDDSPIITLGPARMLQGKVIDADGKGVPEATVQVMLQHKSTTPLLTEVRTDEYGAFRWDGAPQNVFVTVSKPGYKSSSEKMTAGELTTPVTLEKIPPVVPVKTIPAKPRERRKGYDPSRIFRRLS